MENTARNILAREGYRPMLALIHTKHDDGTPALIKVIRDQDEIELNGGEEFVTLFVKDLRS